MLRYGLSFYTLGRARVYPDINVYIYVREQLKYVYYVTSKSNIIVIISSRPSGI